MKKKIKILAIILARSGSKQLPNKNTKLFFRKPLICHTFEVLKKSKIFHRIILSTNSKKYIKLAKKNKIEAPFVRPKKLSTSKSNAIDSLKHAMEYVKKTDREYDYVQYVMPTTPLKEVKDFKKALQLIIKKSADMIVSVSKSSKPKEWFNSIGKNRSLKSWAKYSISQKNRQEFKDAYSINGCIYLAKWNVFFKKKNWFKQKTFAYVMPKNRSIDIDDINDFREAEYYYKKK